MRWKDVKGYEGLYSVSEDGRVYSIRYSKMMKPWTHPDGHAQVRLWLDGKRTTWYVHRIVASTFLKPEEGREVVRHLDGNPRNNHVDNLAWGTQSDNIRDAVRHGTHAQARKNFCVRGHPIVRVEGKQKDRKCQPCAKLRRSKGMNVNDPRHGTNAGYCTGCRCDRCREGKKASR